MARRKYSAEEIVNKLREGEVLIAGGATVAEASRKLGISDQTYYKWRREYGGLKTGQAKRFKELEQKHARLKRLLGDAELDKAMLQEVARGNF